VTATDLSGRTTTTETKTVTFLAYKICPLYDADQVKNIGSNYTIKLQLCDKDNRNVSARNITLTVLTIDLKIVPGPNDSGKANAGYEFRYNAADNSYIYNVDTSKLEPGLRQLYFTTKPVQPRPTAAIDLNTFIDTAPAPFQLRLQN
jgi:hypothetical protein